VKALVLISRLLLGLIPFVFGLNGFFHFIPAPMPDGIAGQYLGALFVSHYLAVVFALELLTSVLLIANRFVVPDLAILANIVLFHACMEPAGFAPAIIAVALWSVLLVRERAAFSALWSARGIS
jgi:putative oxidoreductase